VDQLALEVHASAAYLATRGHGAGLGRLWAAASAAGMALAAVELTPCAPDDEAPGCHEARPGARQ